MVEPELNDSDQEIFEDSQDAVSPSQDDSCDNASVEWNEANLNGLAFDRQELLSNAVETLKNIIYMAMFQIGPKDEVHDPNVNRRYIDYISEIGNNVMDNITNNKPLQIVSGKPEIEKALAAFYEVFKDVISNLQNTERSLCYDFLKLHLKCFPYCQRSECLSMD
jgi:hypothetical protein